MSLIYTEIDPRKDPNLVQALREALALAEQLAAMLPDDYPLPPPAVVVVSFDNDEDGNLRSIYVRAEKETTA
ncbi:MAG: hypothetical protein HYZ18_04255 [Pseudogulbenkiania sp.]|nr:hypothetical protein [Pseudogulbenkiania sp.]